MELAYWLWDAAASEVIRCFMVPRGSTLIAGGPATTDSREFTLSAERGSATHGSVSNPYLDRAARATHYEVAVRIGADGSLSYEEDTVLEMAGQPEPFHHTDRNRLTRAWRLAEAGLWLDQCPDDGARHQGGQGPGQDRAEPEFGEFAASTRDHASNAA